MKFLHSLLGTKLCKSRLVWRQNVLQCASCGRIAGFRYQIGDGDDSLRVYLFPQFEDRAEDILHRSDTHRIVCASDVLGNVSFVDFETAIIEMRDKVADITYHAFDGLGFYTPREEFDEEEEINMDDCPPCGDHSADPDADVCTGCVSVGSDDPSTLIETEYT